MYLRVIPLFLTAAIAAGCSVEKETILAPTDAFMTLRSDVQFVAANATATISAELKKIDGTPAPDGTEIVIQASAGTLDQQKLRVKNGTATATFRAGATTGTVRITASSGAINAELSLRVGSAPPGNLSIVPGATVLPAGGGETEVVATVSSSTGALVAGAPVSFSATAGTVSASDVTTNERGEARTTLRTPSTATVSATVLGLAASTTVRVRIPAVVRVSASPSEPTVGQAVTVTVAVTADGSPLAGRLRLVFGDGQTKEVGGIGGSHASSYTWTKEGGYNLSAEFTDADGFVTRETVRVTVKAEVVVPPAPTPTPTPNPTPPPGGSADQLNPSQVTWLHQDVSRWSITSTVTDVSITRSEICVDHTRAGRFPTSTFGTIQVEGNVWIFANINGRWYGATYDWLRPGQVCKAVTGGELGPDQIRIAPLDASWPGPRSGETVGFMVSTRARDDVSAGEERTNIVLVKWP